jgi:8-oxo-dGTP pyrophosphatase MutT (NUDIX family)
MKQESVAKLLILNDKNEALVLTTGAYKEHPEKEHKPDLPGGLVEPGEAEQLAAIRETEEEAGITLDPATVSLAYAETKFYPAEDKSVTKLLYLARLAITPPVTISWEHEKYEWIAFDTILATHEFRPFYKEAIAYVQNNQLI